MIQFADMDRDGMIDMLFYSNKSIHVHYNQHNHQVFDEYSITDVGETLCQDNSKTQNKPIFDDVNNLTPFDFATQGTSNISIQHLLIPEPNFELTGLTP